MIIDTHAHLTWDSFKDDLPEVLERAEEAGISTIINIGADIESSLATLRLAQGNKSEVFFYSSIGLHPHEASRLLAVESIRENIGKLEEIYHYNHEIIIAIGECGLDYFFEGNEDYTPSTLSISQLKSLQLALFKDQVSLAKKLVLPLIIHNRDAWENILIPELKGTKGVFHSFRGSLEQAQKIIDLGYYLGITCVITYPKNDELRQIIREVPLERLLPETDCPFLPPQDKRGQRNEPSYVSEVIRTIAQVKGVDVSEVARVTLQNAQRLFRLTPK